MTQAPKSWGTKDPDARLDYIYTIPLDADDTVASFTLEKLSGDATIDAGSLDPDIVSSSELERGQEVTAWIEGGTDGETNVFRISWETVAGREDNGIILLGIGANEPEALALTGYAKPEPAHLLLRYPEFAAVDPGTIQFWLTDAERLVTTAWLEGDYAAGLMALAAHNMARTGLGTSGAATASLPAGLTSVKSGSLSLQFSEGVARDRAAGAYGSTIYGAEFEALLRINRGGPRVMGTGSLPYDPLRYPQGAA